MFHNLAALRRAGVLEAAIALEPESASEIRAAVGSGARWQLNVRYLPWQPASGITGAMRVARSFLGDEPVLLGPADALHRGQVQRHIASFADERLDAMALRLPGAPCNGGGDPVPGGYLLSPHAVSLLLGADRAAGDPLAALRARGAHVRVQETDGCLPCHGGQDGLLEANRRVLEELDADVDPAAHPSCEFQGPVRVHPTARLDHTLVRGPAVIGPGARLSHAYVGPYTSVGADVVVDGAQVEHSIVLEGAQLSHIGTRIEGSVIGRGARVTRSFALPTAMRLSVGDGAEVTLS
jgi:glucose-1-phosphate thymidylyltransferase